MTRDEAIIIMCESNLQRTKILPSEKAFSYRMRLEAMKRQSGRPGKDYFGQVGQNSRDELAEATSDSARQIHRYIRLTYLVPELLTMVDEGRIAFNPAVELSYVRKGEDHIKLLEPGEEFRREDGSMGVNYNVKRVFDISQTSAKSRPAKVQHDMRLLLKAMLNNAPCPVEISEKVPDGVGALYNDQERKIYVRQGMDGPDIFRCLAQELSHAHMDRDDNYTRSRHAFTAYCSAYTLCSRYGVDTKNFSFKTIPETMGNMESQDVRTELAKIRDCANQISMDMSKILEKGQKERSSEAR